MIDKKIFLLYHIYGDKMKKLDNRGWGLGIFVIYVCIFFMAIVLVSYIADKNNLGADGDIQMTTDDKILLQYKEYESEVKNVALKYQKENYPDMNRGDSFSVNINKLEISDRILHRCSGYVIFSNKEGIYSANPYLKCGSYRTSGYSSNLDN